MQVNQLNSQAAWLWRIERPALDPQGAQNDPASVLSIHAIDSFETAPQQTVFDDALSTGGGYDATVRSGTVQERFSAVMHRLAENETLFHDVFERASLDYEPTSVESIRRRTVSGDVDWRLQPVLVDGGATADLSGATGNDSAAAVTVDGVPTKAAADTAADQLENLFDRVREFLRGFSVASIVDGLSAS